MTVRYSKVNGTGFRTILVYDTVSQDPVILTPTYPGMKLITGYVEPGSVTEIETMDGDIYDAEVDARGFFKLLLDDNIYDDSIILRSIDIAGNEKEIELEIPSRAREAQVDQPACTIGEMIQNEETSMVDMVATRIDLEKLDEGPITVPVLVANYFHVGDLIITKDANGALTFDVSILEENHKDGAEILLKVSETKPSAGAMDSAEDGISPDEDYTPAEGASSVWVMFMYDHSCLTWAASTKPTAFSSQMMPSTIKSIRYD